MDEQPVKERPDRSRRREEAIGARGVGGDQAILRAILEAVEDAVDVLGEIRDGLDMIAEIRGLNETREEFEEAPE